MSGILFNHESPRRGETFVTRKVTRAAARIKLGLQDRLFLGNLEARRDWGFAGDYVEAMWLMLQQDRPEDLVICTGESHSVRELLDVAFGRLNLDWERYVEIDPRYFRPSEVDELRGDMTRARRLLKWEPGRPLSAFINGMVDWPTCTTSATANPGVPRSAMKKIRAASSHEPTHRAKRHRTLEDFAAAEAETRARKVAPAGWPGGRSTIRDRQGGRDDAVARLFFNDCRASEQIWRATPSYKTSAKRRWGGDVRRSFSRVAWGHESVPQVALRW